MSTASTDTTVLVVGCGSIGRRHVQNLRSLGVMRIGVCDPDPDRLRFMTDEHAAIPFGNFEAGLTAMQPDAVFICTPPAMHVMQARQAVQAGADAFVEKPLSHTMDGVDDLFTEASRSGRIVQVGYNLRFHPGLRQVKQLLDDGIIGRVLWARVEFGQYLPDWRPWQDYRQSYSARRELGGGIILDASHDLDYITWLLGRPTMVGGTAGTVSSLDVDVEDSATILLRFEGGAQADVHMDFVQRAYSRSCKLVGEHGTILWDYPTHQVSIYEAATGGWRTTVEPVDGNAMYVTEVRSFLDCVHRRTPPSVDLDQARLVLKIALTAQAAVAQGAFLRL